MSLQAGSPVTYHRFHLVQGVIHSVLVYMGQPKWDTRQHWEWDMGQCLLGHEKLRDRHGLEDLGTLDKKNVDGTFVT